ncbi:MAG: MerR family transcriptional regulator [Rhizobiaceae bacterium]
MDKSPDAFRTISEVGEDLDLPQHVLRFWETRFTQIKPLKRGGGRRYYRPADVELLKGIRHLLYDQGYTIKGVQRLLKDNGNQFVIALGSGDKAAADEIARQRQAAHQGAQESAAAPKKAAPAHDPEDDTLVGAPKLSVAKRFFGLGKQEGGPVPADMQSLAKDNRALLQEVLFDLLECKRLLDQIR